jgi:hypothetical protein
MLIRKGLSVQETQAPTPTVPAASPATPSQWCECHHHPSIFLCQHRCKPNRWIGSTIVCSTWNSTLTVCVCAFANCSRCESGLHCKVPPSREVIMRAHFKPSARCQCKHKTNNNPYNAYVSKMTPATMLMADLLEARTLLCLPCKAHPPPPCNGFSMQLIPIHRSHIYYT